MQKKKSPISYSANPQTNTSLANLTEQTFPVDPIVMLSDFYQPFLSAWKGWGLTKLSTELHKTAEANTVELSIVFTDGNSLDFQLHFEFPSDYSQGVGLWVTVEDDNKEIIMKILTAIHSCFGSLGVKINIVYYEDRYNPIQFKG